MAIMRRNLLVILALVASVVLSSASQASNMRFLEFSPSAFFTEKDWELLRSVYVAEEASTAFRDLVRETLEQDPEAPEAWRDTLTEWL